MQRKLSFKLAGGRLQAGIAYNGSIECTDGSTARVIEVMLPTGTGLESDPGEPARLRGTPAAAGELSIGVTYDAGAGLQTASMMVFVNHDPKSLWKDLPSDQNDPHWKPDAEATTKAAGPRRLVAASKRGRSHAHEGKFRDDDYHVAHTAESGWTVIAVADGAGSASKSRLGSKVAVERAAEVLLERLAGCDGAKLEEVLGACARGSASRPVAISTGLYPVLGMAAFEACKRLEQTASELGTTAKDLSTTLLLAVHKLSTAGHLVAAYWVGDGGVGLCLADGTPRLLGKVDSGEFAGQTRFLDRKVMSAEEIIDRLDFAVVDDFKAVVAMTDGITDPYFQTDNNLESRIYWDKLWAELDPVLAADDHEAALLSWLDFWSPGNHDDRTIAILW